MTHDAALRANADASPTIGAGLVAGIIAGANVTGLSVAKASLLFTGPLAAGLAPAVTGVLLGSAVMAAWMAWRSGVPATVAGVQDIPAAALVAPVAAAGLAAAAAETGVGGDPAAMVPTAFAIVMGATLTSALILWLVGRLRLGGVVRYFPHPVIAGFLASTGWVLLAGGVDMVSPAVTGAAGPLAWLPAGLAMATGLSLALATRIVPHAGVTLAVLAAAGWLFWAVLALAPDIDAAGARGMGLLAPETGAGVSVFHPRALAAADWSVVAEATPVFGVVALLCLFATLLNVGALEAAVGYESDADRELRATGLANLLAAPFGSPPGYAYVSMTGFAHRVGGGGRIVGYVNAATLLAGVAAAGWMLTLVPPFVFAGLVICLGIDFLWDWIIRARHRMTRGEWGVVVAITAVTAVLGFLPAIALGLAMSTALFLWEYARTPVVRRVATLAAVRSTVDRSAAQEAALDARGDVALLIVLQGYLFFGTAERVLARVRDRLADATLPPLAHLIVDLRHVTGVDTASVAVLRRLSAALDRHGATLRLTEARVEVAAAMRRASEGGLPDASVALDTALAAAEASLLAAAPVPGEAAATGDDWRAMLAEIGHAVHFEDGARLFRAGDKADHLLVLTSGAVEVRQPGDGTRLRVLGPDAVVGEIGPYLGGARTADVVATGEVAALRLDAPVLAAMERDDPARAARLHRALAQVLARRVADANRLLRRSEL